MWREYGVSHHRPSEGYAEQQRWAQGLQIAATESNTSITATAEKPAIARSPNASSAILRPQPLKGT